MALNPSQQSTKPPQIAYNTNNAWVQGLYTRLNRDRTPLKGLATTENVQLTQNGTVAPRPGTRLYGTYQPTGTVIGQVFEFVKPNSGVNERWLVWAENRSGTVFILVNKDGGTPTTITSGVHSINGNFHYEQIAGLVVIANGVDPLSYFTISTLAFTQFTSLATPTAVSATATSVSGSTYTLRYRVAAANQGESAASNAVTVGITKLRETWNGTSEFVTFVWNRPTSGNIPKRWNIYVGDQAGSEYYLDSVPDAGTGTTQSYVDSGSIAPTATRVAPPGDSSSGPKVTRMTNIKGQMYMVGDADNPGRIWFGSTNSGASLDFSSYNGGGWVEPNTGGKDVPVKIVPFRDGKGTPMAACLSKGTNGAGKRYLLQPATTTLGSTVISYMAVTEDNGQDGTDSPDGVVILNDALWYPSQSGFKTSSTRAQIQNIISTTGISDNISTDVNSLSPITMSKCVGITYDQRIYWSLPNGSTTNNEIWVLDLRQQGAWLRPWRVAADWLLLYGENVSGKTLMLGLVNNQFIQFDQTTTTNDSGVVFQTNVGSGSIKFGSNEEWAAVIDVTFYFLNPQGDINLSVNATTDDGVIPFTDVMSSGASQVASSWGRHSWGGNAWGGIGPSLKTVSASKARQKWTIEIGESCQAISWNINTTDIGVNYELAKVVIRSVPIGYLDVSNGS